LGRRHPRQRDAEEEGRAGSTLSEHSNHLRERCGSFIALAMTVIALHPFWLFRVSGVLGRRVGLGCSTKSPLKPIRPGCSPR
jgi:hypothetical protein